MPVWCCLSTSQSATVHVREAVKFLKLSSRALSQQLLLCQNTQNLVLQYMFVLSDACARIKIYTRKIWIFQSSPLHQITYYMHVCVHIKCVIHKTYFSVTIRATSQIQNMWHCKGEAGSNQEASEVNFFLHLFSTSTVTSDGEHVLASSSSEKRWLFQHITSRSTIQGVIHWWSNPLPRQ